MNIAKLNFFLSCFLLALSNNCTTEESGVPIEKAMDDSFFAYSGNEFAMEDYRPMLHGLSIISHKNCILKMLIR